VIPSWSSPTQAYRLLRVKFIEEARKALFEAALKLRDPTERFDCEGQADVDGAAMEEDRLEQSRLPSVIATSNKIDALEVPYTNAL